MTILVYIILDFSCVCVFVCVYTQNKMGLFYHLEYLVTCLLLLLLTKYLEHLLVLTCFGLFFFF